MGFTEFFLCGGGGGVTKNQYLGKNRLKRGWTYNMWKLEELCRDVGLLKPIKYTFLSAWGTAYFIYIIIIIRKRQERRKTRRKTV